MSSLKKNRRGASMIEMTFVGIPLIFVLISIFEMARGMWLYETAAHAAREGMRFSVVHGLNCVLDATTGVTNNCGKTIAQTAQVIKDAGVGLDPATTTIRFTSPSPGGTTITCTLVTCASITKMFPLVGSNQVGTNIRIDVSFTFNSAIAMLWPGSAPVSFASTNLGATSIDAVQF